MTLTRETLAYTTEAEWLEARKADITSTECAALFDAGVYDNSRTQFELYNIKSGLMAPVPFKDNDRVIWGNRLEASIAQGIAEDFGLIVEAFKVYMRITELRMGSSFDFRIVGIVDGFAGDETLRDLYRKHGDGIMEVKNVDGLQFRRAWIDDGDTIEAPPHIEMQVAHQLEVAGLQWSVIAPLVGGNTPKVVVRERDAELGAMIQQRAAAFWQMVENKQAPAPNFSKDADTIARLYSEDDGSVIDLSDDPRVYELCKTYKSGKAQAKEGEAAAKTAKAELLTIIGHAKNVTALGHNITAGGRKATFKSYSRQAGERVTISISQIPEAFIEATVPPYRDMRIKETV